MLYFYEFSQPSLMIFSIIHFIRVVAETGNPSARPILSEESLTNRTKMGKKSSKTLFLCFVFQITLNGDGTMPKDFREKCEN